MTKYVYIKTGLTGGGVDDLDGISRTVLSNQDVAHVYDGSDRAIPFEYNSASTVAEQAASRPRRIRPDDFSATAGGVWFEQESGGIMRQGSTTFNSTSGRTVTISPDLSTSTYQVHIETQSTSGSIGDVVISTKANNMFVVKNSGNNATAAFGWALVMV